MYRYKKAEILQDEPSALEKMDKKRLKVALVLLNAVKIKYSETKQFIDDIMEEKCQKKKMSAEEVIFLQV